MLFKPQGKEKEIPISKKSAPNRKSAIFAARLVRSIPQKEENGSYWMGTG